MPEDDHLDHITLTTPHPFNFAETIGYLARSSNESLFHVEDNKVYRMIRVENERVIVELSGSDTALAIRFLGSRPPTKSIRAAVAHYVREWFDFDRDLTSFYQQTNQCPLLKDLLGDYYGLRIVGVPDLFEALCWAITGQQINLSFAYTLKRRFVESFGEWEEWNDRKYWLFPSPQTIALLEVSDLATLQFTGKKSEYILDVAKRMAAGTLSKEGLIELDDFRVAEKELIKIRGVGPWTANYVLMRCLRDPAAFPLEDVGLHNAVKEKLGLDRKPTLDELRQMAAVWSGWEAYATFYLWRSLYHTIA